MQIIIPMSGHSRRFKKAGYKEPKPFIMINGKPMIQHVCSMFSPNDNFVFVCNKEHLDVASYKHILSNIVKNFKIIAIDPHEYGPVHSVLQAENAIDPDQPIIMTYCDFMMRWNYKQFCASVSKYEGAIAVFKGFHPASFGNTFYAYLKANKKLEMEALREKQSFTDNRVNEFASTGLYYLANWDLFKRYAIELLEKKDKVAEEYYCSLIYNYLVRDGLKVSLFEVQNFICWGTPEDLEEYKFWSNYFHLHANQIMEKPL
ncbi:NTP transferase domain-containing protein [Candidatus Dependentiae bacterium]